MGKHTPGPWRLDARMGVDTYVTGGLDGRRGICSTGGYSTNAIDPQVLNDENTANALLIVAAPDLLDLAKELLRFPSMHDDEQTQSVARYVKKLQAAIERAEEKKP